MLRSWLTPFHSTPPRVGWLRAVLGVGCLVGMLCSAPLWTNSRPFPLLPVAAGFPVLAAPWDTVLFVALLVCLAGAACSSRAAVAGFLALALFAALEDQNRWQPWFYMDAVMLGLTLLPERVALAACRVGLALVYFWAGAHKCNAAFFAEVAPFLAKPFAAWLPAGLLPVAERLVAGTPAFEILAALALWIPQGRRAALALIAVMHAVALLVLGPPGHAFNPVVWPWNISMPMLALLLFPPVALETTLADLRRSLAALVVTAVFVLLPLLGFFGWCDAYLSFRLYSGNTARVTYLVSPAMKERLPPELQRHLRPPGQPGAAAWTGPWEFDLRTWSESTLRAPALMEVRLYRAIGRELARHAARPDDLRVWIITPTGRQLVLTAADLPPAAPAPNGR